MLRRLVICAVTLGLILLAAGPLAYGAEGTITISGRVYLPEGDVAPLQGIRVQVLDDYGASRTATFIPHGENSAPYVLRTPNVRSLTIRYVITLSDYAGPEYIRHGYYTGKPSPGFRSFSAMPVHCEGNDVNGIDIYISAGVAISGTISLPEGYVAPKGGAHIEVANGEGCWVDVIIPMGHSSVGYTLTVPPRGHNLRFYSHSDTRFLWTTFYTHSGPLDRMGIGSIDVSQGPVSGIDIELIPGLSIIGTVTSGSADSGNRYFTLQTQHGHRKAIFMRAGQSTTSFVWTLPPDPDPYFISYYYNPDGSGKKMPLILWDQDIIDVHIVSSQKPVISGKVFLPEGMVAPAGGLRVFFDDYYGQLFQVNISEGYSFGQYYMVVSPINRTMKYTLTHELQDTLMEGYYSVNGVVSDKDKATIIQARPNDKIALDILLPRVATVSGFVSLPEGEIAPEDGLNVIITSDRVPAKNVTIPAGVWGVSYSIEVLVDVYSSTDMLKFRASATGNDYFAEIALGQAEGISSLAVELKLVRRQLTLATIIGKRGYSVNGEDVDLTPVKYNENNDTIMPLRMLEALGAEISWDEETQTATLKYGGNVVLTTIGLETAVVNGRQVELVGASGRPVPAMLSSGRTMVPTRFISENLGFTVEWQPPGTLLITTK